MLRLCRIFTNFWSYDIVLMDWAFILPNSMSKNMMSSVCISKVNERRLKFLTFDEIDRLIILFRYSEFCFAKLKLYRTYCNLK